MPIGCLDHTVDQKSSTHLWNDATGTWPTSSRPAAASANKGADMTCVRAPQRVCGRRVLSQEIEEPFQRLPWPPTCPATRSYCYPRKSCETALIANHKTRHQILQPDRRRIVASTAFSHSLGQKPTLLARLAAARCKLRRIPLHPMPKAVARPCVVDVAPRAEHFTVVT